MLPLCAKSWTVLVGGGRGVLGDVILVHFYFETEEHTTALIFFQVHSAATRWPSGHAQVFPGVIISKPDNLN